MGGGRGTETTGLLNLKLIFKMMQGVVRAESEGGAAVSERAAAGRRVLSGGGAELLERVGAGSGRATAGGYYSSNSIAGREE